MAERDRNLALIVESTYRSQATPLSMLSFGDEMDDAGANNLSMGENTAKRFREAPPPAATLPAMTIEMLSAFNRSTI
jgi:hypothetical protein